MIIGRRAKKAAGGYIGGKVPWGCYLDEDRNVAELGQRDPALQQIREEWANGVSLRNIATKIEEEWRIPTSYQAVRRLMQADEAERLEAAKKGEIDTDKLETTPQRLIKEGIALASGGLSNDVEVA